MRRAATRRHYFCAALVLALAGALPASGAETIEESLELPFGLNPQGVPVLVRKAGDVCTLAGTLSGAPADANWKQIAIVPDCCRPSKRLTFSVDTSDKKARVALQPDGVLTNLSDKAAYSWIRLDDIRYLCRE